MPTAARPARSSPGAAAPRLPSYALYGEAARPAHGLLHIEAIDARSRLHNWEIAAHVHQGLHQVLWLHSGRAAVSLDDSRSDCIGPAALIIPPGVVHAFSFAPDVDGFVLTVSATMLAEGDAADAGVALGALFAAPLSLRLSADAPESARLQALFAVLHAECHAPGSADGPVPLWLARAIIWRLAQEAHTARRDGQGGRPARRRHSTLYTRWVVLLEAHYRAHWPVSRYAQTLGLSPERLNRLLRTETGQSAQQLLHARLAREACRQLVHVAAPVSSLAFELGFEDPAYFCRFMKRHTGLSPRAYRQHAAADGARHWAASPD